MAVDMMLRVGYRYFIGIDIPEMVFGDGDVHSYSRIPLLSNSTTRLLSARQNFCCWAIILQVIAGVFASTYFLIFLTFFDYSSTPFCQPQFPPRL